MSAAETMQELPETSEADIRRLVDMQKAAHIAEGPMTAERRIDLIDRTIALIVDNGDAMVDALMADFGNRSPEGTLATDVGGTLGALKYAKKNVRKWMKASKRHSMFPLGLLGASTRVEYQPLGCVGNVVPWNFPFNLCFGPMGSIFAAGNRTIIKPSEFTVQSAILTKELCEKYYDESDVAVVLGGPETGAAFAKQPFDHLLFTGATAIASHIMRAAAENLTPVTLELGGKSPVIVSDSADFKKTAARVMTGKTLNAGQICLAPDYVMVPEGKVDEFVAEASDAVETMFPTLKDNPDYTSVVNQRHYDRLQGYLDDARERVPRLLRLIRPMRISRSSRITKSRRPLLLSRAKIRKSCRKKFSARFCRSNLTKPPMKRLVMSMTMTVRWVCIISATIRLKKIKSSTPPLRAV